MFERAVSASDVRQAIEGGEIIEDYPEDEPYPSRLILWQTQNGPIHVVVGYDEADSRCHVVTVYQPDRERWSSDFRRRTK